MLVIKFFAAVTILLTSTAAGMDTATLSIVGVAAGSGSTATRTTSVYLSGGSQNGQFDSVSFVSVPLPGKQFASPNSGLAGGSPFSAGALFTFRNRYLEDQYRNFEQSWKVLGAVTTANEVRFNGGPLGVKITTAAEPGGQLFLANFHQQLPLYGGTATVTLFNAGAQFGQPLTVSWGVPEPAGVATAGVGLVSVIVAGCRRRS